MDDGRIPELSTAVLGIHVLGGCIYLLATLFGDDLTLTLVLKNKLFHHFFLCRISHFVCIGCGKKYGASNLPSNLKIAFYKQNPVTSGQSISTKGSDRSTAWLEAGGGEITFGTGLELDGLVQKVLFSFQKVPGLDRLSEVFDDCTGGADNLIIVENYEKY